ncbi:MAG: YheC/YheD family protein [Acidibacillus sp.]|uniref:Endospore coat-associated protein YheD n=1 Tax=Sulfoacidibacillus ferrooxidans TaxID=2005001 RepID=A0A9X2AC47_9BACL|nr:YheC/YheD family protein [Sulfoacidibacillus ferrooxidans]MCI0181885.1 Endospore coat-associated protein YheD [Sulfoacidibacillus ferrooxidans]MCY0892818.1 YheC/YheD family protein [Acidibacillus sp.]
MGDPRPIPISKWTKYCILKQDAKLSPYLPETHPYSPATLATMLQAHGRAVIKSEMGEGGNQVVFVHKRHRGFTWHDKQKRYRVAHFRELSSQLPDFTKRERCIVQRYVPLQRMHGHATDIRMIIQKNERELFEVSGAFVKIAPSHTLITNVKQGGTIDTLSHYLEYCYSNNLKKASRVRRELYVVSLSIGESVHSTYSNTVYGIDFGISPSGHPFILEINTKPSLNILQEVDTGMFKRAVELRTYNQLLHT